MKRLCIYMLSVVFVLTMLASTMAVAPVSAATDVVYTIQTVETDGIEAGETFTVKISVNKIPKICMIEFLFAYDATMVTPIKGTAKGVLESFAYHMVNIDPIEPKHSNSNIGEIWITGMDLKDRASSEGAAIAYVRFQALKDINKDLSFYSFQTPLAAYAPVNPLTTKGVDGGVDVKTVDFSDVAEKAWHYEAIQYVAKKGYITGYNNGTFRPGNNMERQDFVVVLSRIAGADLSKYKDKTGGFSDVKKGSYYAPAVAWAVDKGYITGYSGTSKFGVSDPLTREQVCTILYRYKGSPKVSDASATLKQFPDRSKIGSYAKDAAAWAVDNGIITGSGSNFAPKENASRAQIATIVMRMGKQGLI